MRIALDASQASLGSAGTVRYADELAAALHRRTDIEVVRVRSRASYDGPVGRAATVLAHDLTWYMRGGRAAARGLNADIYHIPIARGPLRRGSLPTVITVHDVAFLRNPETMGRWNRRYSPLMVPRMLRAADLIITPSADTANDVERLLGVSADRIRTVLSGVSDRFFGAHAHPSVPVQPYVLFVGTREPRKNLGRLIEAMALRRRDGRAERLVVVGSDGWGNANGPSEPAVDYLGRVDDAQLHALYAAASCLVLPSLHEGFGLPVLEAMAAGAPVVAARSGALPEICGNAAVLIDPLDVSSIANGVNEAITDADVRRALGHERARQFSWSAAAKQTVDAYRSVL